MTANKNPAGNLYTIPTTKMAFLNDSSSPLVNHIKDDGDEDQSTDNNNEEEEEVNLFQAAKDCDAEKLYHLLNNGADSTVRDENGRTALHFAVDIDCQCSTCCQNSLSCIYVLLYIGNIPVNIQDNDGLSALHIAAENQMEKCCQVLIYFGADLYAYTKSGEQALTLIAKKTPDVLVSLLDNTMVLDGQFHTSERCSLSIDFKALLLGGGETSTLSPSSSPSPSPGDPKDVENNPAVFCPTRCSCKGRNELHLLRSLLKSSKLTRRKVFTHPAVGIFLHLKWQRLRNQFYATFVCYVIWLLMFTSYILMIYLINCPCRYYNGGGGIKIRKHGRGAGGGDSDDANYDDVQELSVNFNKTNDKLLQDKEDGIKCLKSSEMNAGFIILLSLTVIMGLNEVIKILITPKLYFKSRLNILHWILLILVMVTFCPTFFGQSVITPQQYQVAAVTILLAWSLILSQIGKFPSVGQYMEIFGHVLKHFWSFLLTYVSLFVAFAMAFSILFPGNQPYTIFPFAFLKIFVMAVGEMEYQDMFYDEVIQGASGPIVGHILYASFVVIIAIVLMNLLIGLTVSDIRGLQKEAELTRVSRQIVDMFHLESFLYSEKIPEFAQKTLYKFTSVAHQVAVDTFEKRRSQHSSFTLKSHGEPLLPNKYGFKFLPNDSRDKSVPEKFKRCALDLAVKVQNEKKEKVCTKKKCFQDIMGPKLGKLGEKHFEKLQQAEKGVGSTDASLL